LAFSLIHYTYFKLIDHAKGKGCIDTQYKRWQQSQCQPPDSTHAMNQLRIMHGCLQNIIYLFLILFMDDAFVSSMSQHVVDASGRCKFQDFLAL